MQGIFNNMIKTQQDNISNVTKTRQDIIGELQAIDQYSEHIQHEQNTSVKNNLQDIMSEEQVHVGQLFAQLFMLDSESKTNFEKGMKEFENNINK